MNHNHHVTASTKSQIASSIISVLFSFIASSHHWLHMVILLLLGGSTSTLATMSGILWVRRFMIVATLLTTGFSLRKFYKHRKMPIYMKLLTVISAAISIGFVIYTLINFGW